ncbi:hypothetical protein DICPUDRAFT_30504 [Dictyostelium purpureum]|uniref:EH domain-containing protein n=1 Tax=Dictyostelium purpureum TaxID=5786 RepID=F0ZFG6_DICPU|nr:uncharacterized protein DICPUDRAFT_30504 [Dictyostelium purpureum]EGC37272.1 hypothetical protein DICPUDRAFT_30504 [Dictyostelium purpureum]|eukprot:XP_003286160.1 hypothetical protein DICPUDRAFT_30504 [Dictyostelium purpureum]
MKKLNVSESKETDKLFTTSIDALKNLYSSKIKPLETLTKFGDFYTPTLTDSDIEAKPMVLLIGQYSTGKTTFIQYLCERDVPGQNIGPEPTTDRFNAVMYGNEDRIIPGNTVCVQEDKPFKGLARFGTGFMNKFQCSMCSAPILQSVSFIDTPGVLSGSKQSQRSYDFPAVTSWFAERADMILLLFDAHKLDISDEFKQAIEALKGHDEKIKIVLNKADKVSSQQLLRVYGAMMWSLGKVIKTPEVMRVYLGSFWSGGPLQNPETENLLHAEMVDLIKELLLLPKNAAVRKVNDLVKRARMTKVHALILSHLKNEMPVFGKEKKQAELIANLDREFKKIERIHNLPEGDFPDLDRYRQQLNVQDFSKFPKVNQKMLDQIDEVLSNDFPKLLQRFPLDGSHQPTSYELNPFALDEVDESIRWQLFENVDQNAFLPLFNSLNPINGKVTGADAKVPLSQSGLPSNILAQIWRLSDINKEGKLDFEGFCLAMHLVNVKLKGFELPDQLPQTLIPFSKRSGMSINNNINNSNNNNNNNNNNNYR